MCVCVCGCVFVHPSVCVTILKTIIYVTRYHCYVLKAYFGWGCNLRTTFYAVTAGFLGKFKFGKSLDLLNALRVWVCVCVWSCAIQCEWLLCEISPAEVSNCGRSTAGWKMNYDSGKSVTCIWNVCMQRAVLLTSRERSCLWRWKINHGPFWIFMTLLPHPHSRTLTPPTVSRTIQQSRRFIRCSAACCRAQISLLSFL